MKRQPNSIKNRFELEALEQRVLLSADLMLASALMDGGVTPHGSELVIQDSTPVEHQIQQTVSYSPAVGDIFHEISGTALGESIGSSGVKATSSPMGPSRIDADSKGIREAAVERALQMVVQISSTTQPAVVVAQQPAHPTTFSISLVNTGRGNPDVSSLMTEQLKTTLRASNGPPQEAASSVWTSQFGIAASQETAFKQSREVFVFGGEWTEWITWTDDFAGGILGGKTSPIYNRGGSLESGLVFRVAPFTYSASSDFAEVNSGIRQLNTTRIPKPITLGRRGAPRVLGLEEFSTTSGEGNVQSDRTDLTLSDFVNFFLSGLVTPAAAFKFSDLIHPTLRKAILDGFGFALPTTIQIVPLPNSDSVLNLDAPKDGNFVLDQSPFNVADLFNPALGLAIPEAFFLKPDSASAPNSDALIPTRDGNFVLDQSGTPLQISDLIGAIQKAFQHGGLLADRSRPHWNDAENCLALIRNYFPAIDPVQPLHALILSALPGRSIPFPDSAPELTTGASREISAAALCLLGISEHPIFCVFASSVSSAASLGISGPKLSFFNFAKIAVLRLFAPAPTRLPEISGTVLVGISDDPFFCAFIASAQAAASLGISGPKLSFFNFSNLVRLLDSPTLPSSSGPVRLPEFSHPVLVGISDDPFFCAFIVSAQAASSLGISGPFHSFFNFSNLVRLLTPSVFPGSDFISCLFISPAPAASSLKISGPDFSSFDLVPLLNQPVFRSSRSSHFRFRRRLSVLRSISDLAPPVRVRPPARHPLRFVSPVRDERRTHIDPGRPPPLQTISTGRLPPIFFGFVGQSDRNRQRIRPKLRVQA